MENASKALIMAAEVLIGVMIISIGVYLFYQMGQYSGETTKQMEDTQIRQFNNQFLKFYGTTTNQEGDVEQVNVTIHDIIGLANLADKVNEENGFTQIEQVSDSSYYIRIDLQIGHTTYSNLEAKSQSELIQILKDNAMDSENATQTKKFYCSICTMGENTKRVNYMKFVEF